MNGSVARTTLEDALELVGGALLFVDRESIVLAWTGSAERFFARTAGEAVGRPAPRAIAGAQERVAAAIRAAAEGARAKLTSVFIEGRGGARVEVDLVVGAADDGGVAMVVTPRAGAHGGDEGERRLAQVLDAIPSPIFYKDADCVYRGCNAAFEAFLGRPRDRIVGHAVEDVAPPHLARIYKEADLALMRRGEAQVYEALVRDAQGIERDVLFTKGVLRDEHGAVDGLVGTMLDVTERKRAEQAVAASEERLHLVLASIGEVFWDWDVQSDALYVSPYIERLVGIAAAAVPTMRALLRRVHRADRRAVLRATERDAFELEYRLRSAQGEWKWVRTRAKVVSRDGAGAARRVVGASADVTERKHLEQTLQLRDRLSSLGTLAAGVAHEVNNPLCYVLANLNFVLGALSASQLAQGGEQAEDVLVALRDARAGAERMREVVRDLRLLSRTDDDTVGPVNVEAALDAAIALVRHELRHRARLLTQYGGVPEVRANAARLNQVFLNLLINAVQAIPDGAADVNVIRVGTRLQDGDVLVEIQDSGCGIDPNVLPRIFDPFFTTKPVGVGTGLGLSISHRIVTSLGGRLDAESTPGHGSTFRVALPAARARTSARGGAKAPARAAARPASRRRVLVLDDEPAVTAAIRRALSSEYEIVAGHAPRSWLDRLVSGAERFDVILCDLMMPNVNGIAFYERLRSGAPDQATRLLIMTGGAVGEEACRFLSRFENPVIEKPIDFAQLRDLIAARAPA